VKAREVPADRYACHRLSEMAEALQARYGVDCSRSQVAPFMQGHLVVTQNTLHRVDHIGFRIFSERLMAEDPSPVYRFVERYLLELFLMRQPSEVAQRLAEDKVVLKFGTSHRISTREALVEVLPRLPQVASIVVLTDNNRYSVSFYESSSLLFAIRFPIQYELLWGMNKKEVESTFYEDLLHYRMPERQEVHDGLPENDSLLVAADNGCFVEVGESYLIEAVNDNHYYRRSSDGRFRPVRDVAFVEESVRNLFLLPFRDDKIVVAVTLRLYNHRKVEFDIPLDKLLAFCREMGCRSFVGVESVAGKQITGTLVFLNPAYGYCHQLYFTTDSDVLTAVGRHKMKAELYVYVPTHNVNSLFAEKTYKSPITKKYISK